VGPRAGLDGVEKIKFVTIPGPELRPLGRPARSQSLYRLRYLGSLLLLLLFVFVAFPLCCLIADVCICADCNWTSAVELRS
jgi:hypothetical protein